MLSTRSALCTSLMFAEQSKKYVDSNHDLVFSYLEAGLKNTLAGTLT